MNAVIFGYGPLERWLSDDKVTEVMVNAGRDVWVERDGLGPQFAGHLAPGVIDAVLERILAPIGRRLDRSSPIVDARLADGSRVCAVLPPVAVDGPCLSIRRFAIRQLALTAFAPGPVAELVHELVRRRCNIVVSGATSSGKTTLLNTLAGLVPVEDRIVTIEDTAELRLDAPHVLRLECRVASADGLVEIGTSDLLRAALRLRPDRLVVGEIRGDEANTLLQALNTGHDGSLATVHANSAVDALARLESLVVRGCPAWPLSAVRDQVRRSIDIVIHVRRDRRGRHIDEVAEVLPVGESGGVRVLASATAVMAPLRRGR
jgi:pilus assembly protein CpaF